MAESHIVLDYEQLTALAVRLDDRADEITQVTLHDLEQDIRTAARVASAHAHWRFALAELAASLPAGTHARNEILNLLGKDKIESAEPTTFAILYDIPAKWDAPAFLRLAHVGIETLDKATELVSATGDNCYADQAAIYRAGNAVVAECRAIATSASGTDLYKRLRESSDDE